MKKMLLIFMGTALFSACNNDTKTAETKTNEDSTAVTPGPKLPYTASYSSSFKMGNDDYSTMIVQGSWKDWENNTMDNMKSWAADTIVAFQSDNIMVKGIDSLQAHWKKGRANYT